MNMQLDQVLSKIKMTRMELMKASDVSYNQLIKIGKSEDWMPHTDTIVKIYEATKRRYGIGLRPSEYLSHECFKMPEDGVFLTNQFEN